MRFPQHETVLVASTAVSRLLLECGVVDDRVSLEGQSCLGLFSKALSISAELQSRVNRCDLAVAWTEDRGGTLEALFREGGVRLVHIQSPFSTELFAIHQSNRFLETLGNTAQDILPGRTVQVCQHLLDWGRDFLETLEIPRDQSLVAVHVGSGSIHKCLEPRRMALLIEQLRRRGMYPVVLEGPADRDAVRHVLQFMSNPPLVLRELDLCQLAGLLAQVPLYIGHDSGVTHLSALLGVSTIALFGPTDPERWAPHDSHVTILRGAPCHCESWEMVKMCAEKPCLQISVEEILTASRRAMECEQRKPS